MLIRVMYKDGRFDMVKPELLNTLLETKSVTSFKRSESWAIVGRDAIRNGSANNYQGPERRGR